MVAKIRNLFDNQMLLCKFTHYLIENFKTRRVLENKGPVLENKMGLSESRRRRPLGYAACHRRDARTIDGQLPNDHQSGRLRSIARSAKTGNALTARGCWDYCSAALRLRLDVCMKFQHEKVSIPHIFFGNAFVERVSGCEGCLWTLTYPSLIPHLISHMTIPVSLKYSYNTKFRLKRAFLFPY